MTKKKKEKEIIKITHIMKDGTVRQNIKGYEIPYNEQTKILYRMIAGIKLC